MIRAFRTQNQEKAEFEDKSSTLMRFQQLVGKISALLNPLTYVLVNLGIMPLSGTAGARCRQDGSPRGKSLRL